MKLKRKFIWRPDEKTALAKLLERHAPEHIYEMCQRGVQKGKRGRPSILREQVNFARRFEERKEEFKGERNPADQAYAAIYRDDFPDDKHLHGYEAWKALRQKHVIAGRKELRRGLRT